LAGKIKVIKRQFSAKTQIILIFGMLFSCIMAGIVNMRFYEELNLFLDKKYRAVNTYPGKDLILPEWHSL
jgi:hypothetical protein